MISSRNSGSVAGRFVAAGDVLVPMSDAVLAEEVLGPPNRIAERPVGVVHRRRPLEAQDALARRGLREAVGMELSAQREMAGREEVKLEMPGPRHAEDRKVVRPSVGHDG